MTENQNELQKVVEIQKMARVAKYRRQTAQVAKFAGKQKSA